MVERKEWEIVLVDKGSRGMGDHEIKAYKVQGSEKMIELTPKLNIELFTKSTSSHYIEGGWLIAREGEDRKIFINCTFMYSEDITFLEGYLLGYLGKDSLVK